MLLAFPNTTKGLSGAQVVLAWCGGEYERGAFTGCPIVRLPVDLPPTYTEWANNVLTAAQENRNPFDVPGRPERIHC